MTNKNRIQLGQLNGAVLTWEKPDGTTVTVDFDEEKAKRSESKEEDSNENTMPSIDEL